MGWSEAFIRIIAIYEEVIEGDEATARRDQSYNSSVNGRRQQRTRIVIEFEVQFFPICIVHVFSSLTLQSQQTRAVR